MTEQQRIDAGLLFCPADPALRAIKRRTHDLNTAYNATEEGDVERRADILHRILGSLGEGSFLQGPIFFHYGRHTYIGKHFYGNFNLTIQDDATVTIGDRCNFGPNVTIVTPCHPMLPAERDAMRDPDGAPRRVCYAKPVRIDDDCWLGACVTVCPGVHIGRGCVIGAGSVVTRDIPPDSFAAGVPCRVIRTLTDEDSMQNRHPERLGGYTAL